MGFGRVLVWGFGFVGIAAVGFLLWPSPIESRAFLAGPLPALEGPLAPNRILEACERISVGAIRRSDKLLVAPDGSVYAGGIEGHIHRLVPDGRGGYAHEVFAEMGGRPMELAFAPDGSLIVADHVGSHAAIDANGSVRRLPTLADSPEGTAGVAVGRDGTLYYGAHTDPLPSTDEQEAAFLGGLEATGASELRAFDPATGRERVLARGLYRPVGVELSADESFVAVAEFFAYRVTRHWLTGPDAGRTDRLLENLPGFPDGLASDGRGTFWISLAGYRTPAIDSMQARPFVKDQLAKLMPLLLALGAGSPTKPAGVVLAVDETGRILRSLHDPEGRVVSQVTTAEIHEGDLYLGSIVSDWIARCRLQREGEEAGSGEAG